MTNVWVDLSALPWNVSPEAYPYPTAQEYISLAKSILGGRKDDMGNRSSNCIDKI